MKTTRHFSLSAAVTFFLLSLFIVFPWQFVHSQPPQQNSNLKDLLTFQDLLKLTAVGNGYSDQTIIVFIPEATTGFDPSYDAYKLNGIADAPQLYSIISCCNLAINALPEIYTNLEIQLGFKVGNNTTYTISANQLYTFAASVSVFLEDTKDDLLIDLKADSIYTFTALTTDNIQRFKLHFKYPAYIDIKTFLEGPFNGSTMNADLNTGGLIPLDQPFNTAPWNYPGGESVSAIPNPDVIDWMMVEVRDAADAANANSATAVERQAGFLLNNGTVVGLDGSSPLVFREPVTQNLFVVLFTRNHLAVMSATPVTENNSVYSYDFTSGADQAYGGTLAQKELVPGIYGMIGGDGNADGVIDNNDKISIWMILAGKKGYEPGDYNLDGQINNKDKNDIWHLNSGYFVQVP